MFKKPKPSLEERVVSAAEAVLKREGSVGPLELVRELLFLQPVHYQSWLRGSPHFDPIEPHIQVGEQKLKLAFEHFLNWAKQNQLAPFTVRYEYRGPRGVVPLRVLKDHDPQRESFFLTAYRRGDVPPSRQKQIEEKRNKPAELTAFQLTSDSSKCHECGVELLRGDLLLLERQQPLCLTCADLDHLEFLAAGDATLTRRAKKFSPLSAVVVRFSHSRKRYERQGILVTPEAIAEAEASCESDADKRAAQRQTAAKRRSQDDLRLIADFVAAIQDQFPGCPRDEAQAIAEHTALRGSGRVGRSAAGREVKDDAVRLSVIAWIRHQHTPYDELLMNGAERLEARDMIRDSLQEVLTQWTKP